MSDQMCLVCLHREPDTGYVCSTDRSPIRRQLVDLPRKLEALELAMTPGPGGSGERVSTSRTHAPMPVRLDALSLAGPGAGTVTAMLHPKLRHWQTTRRGVVRAVVAGAVVEEERLIVEWHRELVRDDDGQVVMVADDDQIGTLPPREWLSSWVQAWRAHFGHTSPVTSTAGVRLVPGARPRWPAAAALPVLHPIVAWLVVVTRAYRQAQRDTIAGASHGYGGDTSRWTRTDDPLMDDLEVRFARPDAGRRATADVGYLTDWLDRACDSHPAIGDFAAELRAVTAELSRVLGEQPDQHWLGRCPARVTDTDTGATRPCGAGLWQDPHASQVVCPRCHCVWGPRRVELMYLATEMRRTWPVDRRRRYTTVERDTVRRPRCRSCGASTDVVWRDVTGTTDKIRYWQPVGATCPAGHETGDAL